jgi:hypothetical protein
MVCIPFLLRLQSGMPPQLAMTDPAGRQPYQGCRIPGDSGTLVAFDALASQQPETFSCKCSTDLFADGRAVVAHVVAGRLDPGMGGGFGD